METQIKNFTRLEMAVLSSEIQSALDKIKGKYGLAELSIGSISFSPFSFSGKISGTVPEHLHFAETYASEEAKYFALQNGLPVDILQKKFVNNGKSHTIIRIETRNPKYPIITHCEEDRKNYKFTVQIVKEILSRNDFT
ncbi:MAG TPA: hypothetical protein PKN12_06240 [Bacteroidales bacterium]|jgi:uncharacterized protein YwbE|nr:hypothetical protein [Bacteroidales bacterium]HPT10017.1 hypothetical protein [Bacteroidales bacterium]